MTANHPWVPCPEHSMMASTLARLDERIVALQGVQEKTLYEVRDLSRRLSPVEISAAHSNGVEDARIFVQQNAPKWLSAKVAVGSLILSSLLALAGLAMVIFGR